MTEPIESCTVGTQVTQVNFTDVKGTQVNFTDDKSKYSICMFGPETL
jgi:hypothetical protein